MMPEPAVQPYRIGWGLLARLAGQYRRILPCLIRGRQPDGRKVARRRYLPTLRRDVRRVVCGHPKRLVHVPWQAEARGLRFARRGLTKAGAVQRVRRDLAYWERTGRQAPYQRWRWWLARGWDRRQIRDLP